LQSNDYVSSVRLSGTSVSITGIWLSSDSKEERFAVVKQDGQNTTKITYEPGSNNLKAHVEHEFVVPATIAEGIYTVIFSFSLIDIHPEDDIAQGEDNNEDDNIMVHSSTMIIGKPDKSNLRILSTSLTSNAFELPGPLPKHLEAYSDTISGTSVIQLNLETESMAQDTKEDVGIVFDLKIGTNIYRLYTDYTDENGESGITQKILYREECRPEDRPDYPQGQRCASLFRQEPIGKTFNLYLDHDAENALKNKTFNTICRLIISLDSDNAVSEWKDNTSDNTETLNIMYLAKKNNSTDQENDPCSDFCTLFEYKKADSSGNEKFASGYDIGPELKYKKGTAGPLKGMPTAVNLNTDNEVWVKMFGNKTTLLKAWVFLNADIDDIIGSYFDYGVNVVDSLSFLNKKPVSVKIYGKSYYFKGQDGNIAKKFNLWTSKDKNGNERFSKSFSYKYTQIIPIFGIPFTITAGVTGEMGIKGRFGVGRNNIISAEVGPYVALDGFLDTGVLIAGAGGKLRVSELYPKLNPVIQILPSKGEVNFSLGIPLVISNLDGSLYLWADLCPDLVRRGKFKIDINKIKKMIYKVINYVIKAIPSICEKKTLNIILWDGLSTEFDLFTPLEWKWGGEERSLLNILEKEEIDE